MAVPISRKFELTATVTFPKLDPSLIDEVVVKLHDAMAIVVEDYPTVEAFFVGPDGAGDVNFGLRFNGANPEYIADMADEILQESVNRMTKTVGAAEIEAEREESVLVLA